jgi:hypothetical protein
MPDWAIPDVISYSEKSSEFVLDQHRSVKDKSLPLDNLKR